jgi:hypothetical protein
VAVSLGNDALAAGRCLPVDVWLENPAETGFSSVELTVAAPASLRLEAGDCSPDGRPAPHTSRGAAAAGACREPGGPCIPLGPLAAGRVEHRRFSLAAGEAVHEGDFQLLFTFRSTWGQGAAERQSLVAVEKKVQIGLLGTESIGGFSLRLVALLLPGLLLGRTLQRLSFPMTANLDSLERTAFAVLSSALLVGLAASYRPIGLADGMSVTRLALLCGAGVTLGLLLGGAHQGVERWRKWRQEKQRQRAERERRERLVQPGDPPEDALAKLFADPEAKLVHNPMVQDEKGRWLSGTTLGPADGGHVLLGCVNVQVPAELREDLERLKREGRWAELLAQARQRKLRISAEPVKIKGDQGWRPWDQEKVWLANLTSPVKETPNQPGWSPVDLR